MVADLINITNLVLADDFETWFQTTNEVIDALNPLQIYDIDDTGVYAADPLFVTEPIPAGFSLGIRFTRDRRYDGDMHFEVHAEPPLGFDAATGALELAFFGPFAPPLLTGTPCGGVNAVANDDLYIVHDVSAGVGGTTKLVTAENQLSPRILCNHTFGDGITPVTITIEGDLIVNGTQTILNTTTVEATDPIIDLNSDGTGTGTPAGDDTLLGTGGIRILSTDGNKNFLWTVADNRWHISSTDAGDRGFQIDSTLSLFTRTIEPLTNHLDLLGAGTGDAVSLHFHEWDGVTVEPEHWRMTLKEDTGAGQVAYAFPYPGDPLNLNPVAVNADGTLAIEHSTTADGAETWDLQIYFDSVTPTYDTNIDGWARYLNADLLDGAHASITPGAFTIPIALGTGLLDPGWLPFSGTVTVPVNQTGHSLIFGDVVRLDSIQPVTALYILARADTEPNAEAVGIVSKVVDANNFELTLRGVISGSPAQWLASKIGGPLVPGEVYFLDKATAGKMDTPAPLSGDIQKTMMIATSVTDAIVMNYVGGRTETPPVGGGILTLTGDVLANGTLTGPIQSTIVERTLQLPAVAGPTPLPVEGELTGPGGYRSFEIMLVGHASLDLVPPAGGWPSSPGATNSVTLIVTQDVVGGWTPTITVIGGTIVWDSSLVQPPHQVLPSKSTVYVLLNVDGSTIWYGSRAVFEL